MGKQDEIYISVDIEASGPIPGEYNMLSIGACVVGDIKNTFYREIKPITTRYVPQALEVSGLSLEKLVQEGVEPGAMVHEFEEWIYKVSGEKRPVFLAFNATFDWSFVHYYFIRFLGRDPFGISGLDIKAYYMGKFHTSWSDTIKKEITKRFPSIHKHTHNALEDAIEQAEIFEQMLKFELEVGKIPTISNKTIILRGILKYRRNDKNKLIGNCFSTCVVNGLQLQNDRHLTDDNYPELAVFNNEILNDQEEEKEFAPALTYLIKNEYDVVIIDPNPEEGNWWGSDLPHARVEKRSYEEDDIKRYIKEGLSVVFSTHGTNQQEHAVLAYGEKLYDPASDYLWNKPFTLEEYIKRAITCEKGRMLIAFRKAIDK